ncbi:AraC family transcriptional regulator [Dysgonomonas capnocytophagoides]|uniref:AraC family transcriptional regulator n=1 Tax=Dysgonomonas capnocytophagoides TaxID=45254 RepID=UPI00333F551E
MKNRKESSNETRNASTLNLFEKKEGSDIKTSDLHFIASDTDADDLDIVGHPVIVSSIICAVCTKGEASVRINFKSYYLTEGAFIVLSPGMMFLCEEDGYSFDFIANYISFSPDLVREISLEHMIFDIKNNPYILLSSTEYQSILSIYSGLRQRFLDLSHPYRRDILRHTLLTAIYDFSVIYDKYTLVVRESDRDSYPDRFFTLLFKNYKKQRKTGFYSAKLNISPKYLSKIVKQETGSSVQDWIFQLILFETKSLLKSTNMNVAEIAEHFNYPDSTSFGKFFKKHEGITLLEYRKS